VRPHFQATDIATDREARLQSVLTDAEQLLQSVEYKLALIGGISSELPRTSAELIWRLQVAQTLHQARSLGKAIDLLVALREDVADLSR
jgi:hypothetical protein